MNSIKILIIFASISSVLSSIRDVKTGGNFEYTYFPMKSSTVKFEIRTTKDATIIISETTNPNLDTDPFLEVIIGGGNNVESVIRRKRPDKLREKVFTVTPDIVSDKEFRGFWIKFVRNTVLVGKSSERLPMMVWTDPQPFKRNYFGVSSCCGATAEWKVDEDSVDHEETPCAPSAVKSMDLPLRKDQKNSRAKLVDGECFDVLLHQCGTQGKANSGSSNYSSYNGNKGNKRFIIDEDLKTWDEAKSVCEGRGQRLASVRSRKEQQQLEEAIQNFSNPFSGVWLAANDRGHAGKFVWYDGTNNVMSYNNWENNARSADSDGGGGKHCLFASYVSLVVKQQAYWYVQQCTDTWNFVCETYD